MKKLIYLVLFFFCCSIYSCEEEIKDGGNEYIKLNHNSYVFDKNGETLIIKVKEGCAWLDVYPIDGENAPDTTIVWALYQDYYEIVGDGYKITKYHPFLQGAEDDSVKIEVSPNLTGKERIIPITFVGHESYLGKDHYRQAY